MVLFAVPGSKVYINRHYKNNPNSFLNISLTGNKCQLMCSHCKALLLRHMIDIRDFEQGCIKDTEWKDVESTIIRPGPGRYLEYGITEKTNRILRIIEKFGSDHVRGLLVSGGFDRSGRLPLDARNFNELKQVKEIFKDSIRIFLHLGFIEPEEIGYLSATGIDGLLVNVFSDMYTIEEVYNLKGFTPGMFYKNLKLLKKTGLNISPHLIIGLGSRGIDGELISIEEMAKTPVSSVVIAIAKKLSKQYKYEESKVNLKDTVRLYEHLKKHMPVTPVSFGCARPPGPEYEALEIELLKRGIDAIAFPSEKTVDFALKNGISFAFKEQCCAFPGV